MFPERREFYMGFCSASLGLGMMLGPVIGQIIYVKTSFQGTFFFFTGLISCSFILAMLVIPSTFNQVRSNVNESILQAPHLVGGGAHKEKRPLLNSTISNPMAMQSYQRITYKEMLMDRRVMFALMSACVAMIFMFFFDSILSDHIVKDLSMETDIGYFFGLICLAYAISAPIVTLLCRYIKRRYVSLFSYLIATAGLLCFGPSKMLNFPEKNIPLTVTGLILLGMGASAIFVPLLAEIIEAIQVKYCVGNTPFVFDKAS